MAHPAIGFIGLGTMGGAMCRHIIEADFPVTVWARSQIAPRHTSTMGLLGHFSERPGHVFRYHHFVRINDAAVEDLVFGQNGVASGEVFGKT